MKIAIIGLLAGVAAAQAQSTTRTSCFPVGTSVTCTARTEPEKNWLKELGAAIQADAELHRQAEALRARQMYDSARIVDARLEAQRLEAVRWESFRPRAVMLMQRAVDSVGFGGGRMDSLYWSEQATAVNNLYAVAPLATNQQIADAIEPVLSSYLSKRKAFDQRAVAILTRVSDSLQLRGEAQKSFWARASVPLIDARRENWRTIDTDLRAAIDGVVLATRLQLTADSLKNAPPMKAPVKKKPPT